MFGLRNLRYLTNRYFVQCCTWLRDARAAQMMNAAIRADISISSGKDYVLSSSTPFGWFLIGAAIVAKPFAPCATVLTAHNFAFRRLSRINRAGTAIPMNIDTVKTIASGTWS